MYRRRHILLQAKTRELVHVSYKVLTAVDCRRKTKVVRYRGYYLTAVLHCTHTPKVLATGSEFSATPTPTPTGGTRPKKLARRLNMRLSYLDRAHKAHLYSYLQARKDDWCHLFSASSLLPVLQRTHAAQLCTRFVSRIIGATSILLLAYP